MELITLLAFWAFIFWLLWKWFLGDWLGKFRVVQNVRAQFAARQIPDEAFFEMAGIEIACGTVRKGLWIKAMSEAMGDEKKANAMYIRLRVQAMRQEAAAAILHASNRESTAEKFAHDAETAPEQKIVLSCPQCAGRLRVAVSKHLDVTCPHCRAEFRTQT